MDQKKLIITSIALYVLAALGAYLGTTAIASPPKSKTDGQANVQTAEPTPSEPRTEECPINGVMHGKSAKAKWEKRRPLAVVIENHQDARPQSGISDADVVYEANTEGGVTRTLSIFYCQYPKTAGPVRSARVHFINLLREWGNYPLYVHVGGANCNKETGSGCGNGAPADAIGLVNKLGWGLYNDLNLSFSSGLDMPIIFHDLERSPIPNPAWEHTSYVNTDKLIEFVTNKRKLTNVDEDGAAWNEKWEPWTFVDGDTLAKRGNISPIEYNFYDTNTSEYGVRWEYDKQNNQYKRFNGGKPHLDYNTNGQLTASNVFLIEATETSANDDYPGGHVVYDLVGSGNLHVFQNGRVMKGTWEKEDLDAKMKFLDEDGEEISIVRGTVWISLIPDGNEVTYGAAAKKTITPGAKSNVIKE